MNASKNVGAIFSLKSTITISASATAGGTITPSGSTSVNYGANQTYTITPQSGYRDLVCFS